MALLPMEHSTTASGVYEPNEAIPANTYKDYSISFGQTFSSIPSVTANVLGYFNPATEIIGPLITNITTSAFSVRVVNKYSSPLTPKISWIATSK